MIHRLELACSRIESRVDGLEGTVNAIASRESKIQYGDNIGGSKADRGARQNDPKWLAGVLIAIVAATIWYAYYGAGGHQAPPSPMTTESHK